MNGGQVGRRHRRFLLAAFRVHQSYK
jgi:hypothetical protein